MLVNLTQQFISAYENVTQSNCSHHADQHDPEGAAMYVIVVIGWYFLGVVAFLAWQMRKKSLPNDYKTEVFSQNLEEQVKAKQIYEELRNPTTRKSAWNIYGSRGQLRYNPSDIKYEMQVLASFNRRVNEIERKRLESLSPDSPSTSNTDLILKTANKDQQATSNCEEIDETLTTKKWRPHFYLNSNYYKRRMRKKRKKSVLELQKARSLSMPSCSANIYSAINLSNQLQEKQKLRRNIKKLSTLDEQSSTEDF